ncbi:MAG: type II secretion system protein [Pirellulales bacterium]
MIRHARGRAAFTLIELLLVMVLISLLSSAVLLAMYGVLDEAKGDRSRTQVTRINDLLIDRWETYRTRPLRVPLAATTQPNLLARARLNALRELMRMELPDRVTDVSTNPVTGIAVPSLLRGYRRKCYLILGPDPGNPNIPDYSKWSTAHEGSECLYLILSALNEDGTNAAVNVLGPSEVGDTDGDGMPEVLDGWGRPIAFIRWAPAFISDRQPFGIPTVPLTPPDDPFDPVRADPRWSTPPASPGYNPFPLYPLVFSAGPDGLYEVNTGTVVYPTTTPPNDPYAFMFPFNGTDIPAGASLGAGSADNIHNHLLEVK